MRKVHLRQSISEARAPFSMTAASHWFANDPRRHSVYRSYVHTPNYWVRKIGLGKIAQRLYLYSFEVNFALN